MHATQLSLTPAEAWQPLPASEWNVEAARHLLRRAAFSARPTDVDVLVAGPVEEAIERLFTPSPSLAAPPLVEKLVADFRAMEGKDRPDSEVERRRLRRAFQEKARHAFNEFGVHWLQRAADPRYSAYEKFILFLQDVFVVGFQKVRNPLLLYRHQELLRAHGTEDYPSLCKRISRSPAMIMYLDLQQSKVGHPNENFARELFELFTLGEGHYTETDIREAARAFTGYRQRTGEFVFARRQYDPGRKTVFGASGPFDGDGVIDLVFRQTAAASFLPRELVRFYLTDLPVPEEHIAALGDHWRKEGFHTGKLLARFFGSRLFFEPAFRGTLIKSPVQYYIGLLQDLDLQVAPFPRLTLNSLRLMGQAFFNPPNVRGWVGGRTWINASTLAARRQIVESLFTPLDEGKLNADEQADLAAARAAGELRLYVGDEALDRFLSLRPDDAATTVLSRFYPVTPPEGFHSTVADQFAEATRNEERARDRLRQLLGILLQAPQYQLC